MKKILYTAICACSILCGAQAQTPGSEVPNLKKLYELTDSCDVNVRARFSPLIGISASISNGASRVGATYIQSIVKAGGTPVIIPAVTEGTQKYRIEFRRASSYRRSGCKPSMV